jgi:hypothetical protein
LAFHLVCQLLLIFLFIAVLVIPGIIAGHVDLDAIEESDPDVLSH